MSGILLKFKYNYEYFLHFHFIFNCSAGCGRTGTICAIDYVWGLMRMGVSLLQLRIIFISFIFVFICIVLNLYYTTCNILMFQKLTKNFNLFNVIADMRRQRIAMVQTKVGIYN